MKILLTGSSGLVGSAIKRNLVQNGVYEVIAPSSKELDLLQSELTSEYIRRNKPDLIIAAAALVGGINANLVRPMDFLIRNLEMQSNLIGSATLHGIRRLIFISSSCVYQKSQKPLVEEDFLMGPPDENTRAYGIAKIAGMELIRVARLASNVNFTSIIPCNLYGPHDNFNTERSHVIPALLRKFHDAKVTNSPAVEVWGSPEVRREFMHSYDLANAVKELINTEEWQWAYNSGTGIPTSIGELASTIAEIVGYRGTIFFNNRKPRGIEAKLLDSSRLRLTGWNPVISLRNGLLDTYRWMLSNLSTLRDI